MTTFATPLELSQYLTGNPAAVGDLDPAFVRQATLFLECIADDIEAVCGVNFAFGTGTQLLPGTWSRDLDLPRGPITAVTSVSLNGIGVAAGAYIWNQRSLLRAGAANLTDLDEFDMPEDWNSYGMQGATWRAGGHWGGPASTVAVTYAWGSDPALGMLRSMTLRTAARVIGNPANLTQESLAVYSASYGATGDDGSGSHLRAGDRLRLRKKFNRTLGTIDTGGR